MGDTANAASDPSASGPSEWHTIRPWTPHLTLAVREITSVSATFILSSSLDAHRTTDEELEPILDSPNDVSNDALVDSRGIIPDAISHGLSVDVNGSNWQRVILRMNDHADEAIIVIYGLHPGRQYDIDLALVSGGTMRQQVTTEGGEHDTCFSTIVETLKGAVGCVLDAESTAVDHERNDDHVAVAVAVAVPEALASSTSHANETAQSVPSPSQTPTPDERLRVLSHQLNALHAEQATLQSSLKSSRREANKTATSLRAEIDVLKRASEKANIAEGKARQRVRALEDAVRRANDAREQIEEETAANEQDLPGWKGRVAESEATLDAVKKEADEVRAEREKREEEGRKRKESMKGECTTLSQRLERLSVKKDRLENSVIQDLEAQLAELERQIEATERGGFQNGDIWDTVYRDSSALEGQRRRRSHPGTIGRPGQSALRPLQQPVQPISPPSFPRHQHRSQSYRTGNDSTSVPLPPGLTLPPGLHATSSSITHAGPSAYAHSPTSGLSHTSVIPQSAPPSSTLSRSTSSVGSSTLSSKAAPFEPTRHLRLSSSSPNSAAFPSGSLLSMGGQGAFSPSPTTTTYSSSGQPSAFSLSGTFPSNQKSPHGSGGSVGTGQLRLGRLSISKSSAADDPWSNG